MPYIKNEDRKKLTVTGITGVPKTAGELNYLITRLVDAYVLQKGLRYDVINEVIGVLNCVKAEFYRRVAAPYEDRKCAENGDVYDTLLKNDEMESAKKDVELFIVLQIEKGAE